MNCFFFSNQRGKIRRSLITTEVIIWKTDFFILGTIDHRRWLDPYFFRPSSEFSWLLRIRSSIWFMWLAPENLHKFIHSLSVNHVGKSSNRLLFTFMIKSIYIFTTFMTKYNLMTYVLFEMYTIIIAAEKRYCRHQKTWKQYHVILSVSYVFSSPPNLLLLCCYLLA